MENEDVISRFSKFPEGCISNIMCFTSPKDACRWSILSKMFKAASESDTIWERFLPPDYKEIMARSVSPINYSSKKQLYFHLSDSPILLDGGKLSFKLSKSSGKKCYMLCARELQISWGNDSQYWNWISMPESRFMEVADLMSVCWLEIRAKIQAQMLSLNTTYEAYLVFKLKEHPSCLHYPCKALIRYAQDDEVRVELRDVDAQARIVYLQERKDEYIRSSEVRIEPRPDGLRAQRRMDGWMELKLGETCNKEEELSNIVEIMFWEIENSNWKYGLIVEGIELRPVEEE